MEDVNLMERIINIQMMEKRIYPGSDGITTFDELSQMTANQLWELQNDLLSEYNELFND